MKGRLEGSKESKYNVADIRKALVVWTKLVIIEILENRMNGYAE